MQFLILLAVCFSVAGAVPIPQYDTNYDNEQTSYPLPANTIDNEGSGDLFQDPAQGNDGMADEGSGMLLTMQPLSANPQNTMNENDYNDNQNVAADNVSAQDNQNDGNQVVMTNDEGNQNLNDGQTGASTSFDPTQDAQNEQQEPDTVYQYVNVSSSQAHNLILNISLPVPSENTDVLLQQLQDVANNARTSEKLDLALKLTAISHDLMVSVDNAFDARRASASANGTTF